MGKSGKSESSVPEIGPEKQVKVTYSTIIAIVVTAIGIVFYLGTHYTSKNEFEKLSEQCKEDVKNITDELKKLDDKIDKTEIGIAEIKKEIEFLHSMKGLIERAETKMESL